MSSVAVTVPFFKKIGRYEAVLLAKNQIHKFRIHAGSLGHVTREYLRTDFRFRFRIRHQEIPNQSERTATEFRESNSYPK